MNVNLCDPELFVLITVLEEFEPKRMGESLVIADLIKKLKEVKNQND